MRTHFPVTSVLAELETYHPAGASTQLDTDDVKLVLT